MFKRLISSFVCFTFIFSNIQSAGAQDFSINQLPIPGTMVGESLPFAPLALKGLVVNPQKPLEFQFIVDTGKGSQDTATIKDQANQLVKYFLAGLTIPEGDLWVNLSPYEKNHMIPEALGQTDLGRDLLAQDYILKQLTASLIYPEKDLGKEFWATVYAKAQQQFGTTDVPVNTFNKVWILPDQAQVYENVNAAYVTKSTLKVMLDEDYLAKKKHQSTKASSISSQVAREIVIPEIRKEVNTGKNFAPLRQIYQTLILAKWYKETIQNGLLDAVYTNKEKITGVNVNNLAVKEEIYQRYLMAYKKGAFNYIKEDPTPDGQTMPRKYFSGGTLMIIPLKENGSEQDVESEKPDGAMISLTVALAAAGANVFRLQKPKQTPDAAMKIVQEETDQDIAAITRSSLAKVRMYKRAGFKPLLLMPSNLKMTADSAQINDDLQWISKHSLFTAAGMSKTDMAMLSELWQWMSDNPHLAAVTISSLVGVGMGMIEDEIVFGSVAVGLGMLSLLSLPISLEDLIDSFSVRYADNSYLEVWFLYLDVLSFIISGTATKTVIYDFESRHVLLRAKINFWKRTRNVNKILALLGSWDDIDELRLVEKTLVDLKVSRGRLADGYINALTANSAAIKIEAARKLEDLSDKRAIGPLLREFELISRFSGNNYFNLYNAISDALHKMGHPAGDFIYIDKGSSQPTEGRWEDTGHDANSNPHGRIYISGPDVWKNDWHRVHRSDLVQSQTSNDASSQDAAMLHREMIKPASAENGGIDFNQISIKRTGHVIKVQFDPAQLKAMEQGGFEGFTPVIINITPISSPFRLLGINSVKEQETLAKV